MIVAERFLPRASVDFGVVRCLCCVMSKMLCLWSVLRRVDVVVLVKSHQDHAEGDPNREACGSQSEWRLP